MATKMQFSGLSRLLSTHKQETDRHGMQQLHMNMRDERVCYRNCNLTKAMSSMIGDSVRAPDPTPSDTIKQFYECMNEKNIKLLEDYISNDCFFEDYSFPKPFNGKKEVLRFLDQLITGMGENIEFHVGHIYEGDDLIAGVNWHLEWKKKQVPFTRGCSFYRLKREGERLTIRKAQVFVESPIKPGDLFLILLKIVTSLFDAFPEATEWFFQKQRVIVQVLLNIYSMLVVPFLSPIFSFYMNLGNLILRFMSIALKILESCSRLFKSEN
ncbi:uncharacterized protein LOC112522143 [Cynara cardunculus var. scolymus]|uniref:uncharacterized protein LOC112522143 n=1 Tax=Cynara cardunculus var. scolymus TaxID=59895 RepID=UPI000D62941B|nr:uncharacterized protein LOC112522143 [Cynara cardunculus var. scolymus]